MPVSTLAMTVPNYTRKHRVNFVRVHFDIRNGLYIRLGISVVLDSLRDTSMSRLIFETTRFIRMHDQLLVTFRSRLSIFIAVLLLQSES